MNAEIISVGTELLLGHTVNTDTTIVARALSDLGINLLYACTVGDNEGRLKLALEQALQRSDLVITTGGLGPTKDDLTKETIADVAGKPLVEDPAVWNESNNILGQILRRKSIKTSVVAKRLCCVAQ